MAFETTACLTQFRNGHHFYDVEILKLSALYVACYCLVNRGLCVPLQCESRKALGNNLCALG